MEHTKRRGAYAVNRYGYVIGKTINLKCFFFLSIDLIHLCQILMQLLVCIIKNNYIQNSKYFNFRCISRCQKACIGSTRINITITYTKSTFF